LSIARLQDPPAPPRAFQRGIRMGRNGNFVSFAFGKQMSVAQLRIKKSPGSLCA
jgi:hypothetical protein